MKICNRRLSRDHQATFGRWALMLWLIVFKKVALEIMCPYNTNKMLHLIGVQETELPVTLIYVGTIKSDFMTLSLEKLTLDLPVQPNFTSPRLADNRKI